jgi:hypothetical protein
MFDVDAFVIQGTRRSSVITAGCAMPRYLMSARVDQERGRGHLRLECRSRRVDGGLVVKQAKARRGRSS